MRARADIFSHAFLPHKGCVKNQKKKKTQKWVIKYMGFPTSLNKIPKNTPKNVDQIYGENTIE